MSEVVRGRTAALCLLTVLAGWSAPPAAAAFDEAAYERAWFRTVTLLHATAAKEAVAATTRCLIAATKDFPEAFKQTVIVTDRRPVYRGSDRLREIAAALNGRDAAPLSACFDRLAAEEFGPIQGAVPATAAPNPGEVWPCPISVEGMQADDLTCYCRPMLGGIAFGQKTYSDESSICLASRHAGETDYLTGGVVRAVFGPGCASYEGVEANGTLSAARGRSVRSFHFPAVGQGACPK